MYQEKSGRRDFEWMGRLTIKDLLNEDVAYDPRTRTEEL